MRSLIPVLLSLLLGLSALGHGTMRLSVATGTPAVLCTVDGAVSVVLDRNGNPLPATHHHCPDCLPLAALQPVAVPAPAAPTHLAYRLAIVAPHRALTEAPRPAPSARGPPTTTVA